MVLHISEDISTILGAQGSDLTTSPAVFTGEQNVVACEGQDAELKCGKNIDKYDDAVYIYIHI